MPVKKRGAAAAAEAETQLPAVEGGVWRPPTTAQTLELSEFFNFGKPGETVIGRVQRVTERPDPNHPDRTMRAFVLSPAVVHVPGETKGQAFKSLAVGISAHLSILIGNPRDEIGTAFAFQYEGTRPSEGKGKQPSKQFNLYKLSVAEFEAEVRRVAGKDADALMSADGLPF